MAPDAGRLRLERALSLQGGIPLVCPPDAGRFLLSVAARQMSLSVEPSEDAWRGVIMMPGNDTGGRGVQVDLIEDGNLLMSDEIQAGMPFVFPDLQPGHTYDVKMSEPYGGQLRIEMEEVPFGTGHLLSLGLYLMARGDLKGAMDLCDSKLAESGGLGRRLTAVVHHFTSLFPEMNTLFAQPVRGERGDSGLGQMEEMESALRRVLEHQIRGPWSDRLPRKGADQQVWQEVRRELEEAARKEPENESLALAEQVLEAWLDRETKGSAFQLALYALASRLEKVIESEEPLENEGGAPVRS